MALTSPHGNVLRRLEGTPGDIAQYGVDLKTAATVMEETSAQLKKIAEGRRQIAESVDAVRETAAETWPELDKAKTRYLETGDALSIYATALETAQTQMDSLIDSIPNSHEDAADARREEWLARNEYQSQQTDIAWGAEITVAEQNRVQDRYNDAQTATTRAENRLESQWGRFDRIFSTWSDAYDKAVSDIETAFVNADNNDAWGEDLLPILGWIAVGLAVVALFVTGPIALAIAAIGALVGLAMVAISALKFTKGRGNWWELGMSIVGVIPFARPLATGIKSLATGGFRAASTTFAAGRGIVRTSVRNLFPRASYTPFSGGFWSHVGIAGRNVWAATKNAFYATGAGIKSSVLLGRFRVSDFFITRPSMNLFGGGHSSVTSLANFITKNQSSIGSTAMAWVDDVAGLAPSQAAKISNVVESLITTVTSADFLGSQSATPYASFREGFAQ